MITLGKKQKYCVVAFTLFVLVLLVYSLIPVPFDGGDGGISNPYQISNCKQLQNIQQFPSANFELVQDVSCSETILWNVFTGFHPISSFSGSLNGNNHKVMDIYMNKPFGNLGVFASIGDKGVVRNIVFKNLQVNMLFGNGFVGGVTGNNSGLISAVGVHGRVRAIQDRVGGIASSNNGTIINSYFEGEAVGVRNNLGGLVGFNCGEIINSYVDGKVIVESEGAFVGGITGSNFGTYGVYGSSCHEGVILNSFTKAIVIYNGQYFKHRVDAVDGGKGGTKVNVERSSEYFWNATKDWDFNKVWQKNGEYDFELKGDYTEVVCRSHDITSATRDKINNPDKITLENISCAEIFVPDLNTTLQPGEKIDLTIEEGRKFNLKYYEDDWHFVPYIKFSQHTITPENFIIQK